MKTMKKTFAYLILIAGFGTNLLISSCSDDKEKPAPLPVASFTVSTESPIAGESITFTSTSTDATSYQWSFGDGGTSTETSPVHSYSTEGTFSVTLSVTGEGGTDSETMDVVVGYPHIIYADGIDYKIYSVSFGTTNSKVEIGDSPLDNARHFPVAVNAAGTKLFYLDNYNGILYQANVDGTGTTELTTSGSFYYPSAIALDADGNIYVTDRGDADTGEGAYVYKVTPAGVVSVVYENSDGIEVPTAIAIDPASGDLYINDVGATDSGYAGDGIWKGNVSGSTLTKVITGGGYSIALAPAEGKLYFNEAFVDGNIKVANLSDLANPSKYADLDETRSYGLYAFSGKVYWTDLGANVDGGEGTLKRAGTSDGSNPTVILSTLNDPRGITVY